MAEKSTTDFGAVRSVVGHSFLLLVILCSGGRALLHLRRRIYNTMVSLFLLVHVLGYTHAKRYTLIVRRQITQ